MEKKFAKNRLPVVNSLIDSRRCEKYGGFDLCDGLEEDIRVVEDVSLVVEAQGPGDAHRVEDVDGLRGYARVRKETQNDLFTGGGEAIEPRGPDEAQQHFGAPCDVVVREHDAGLRAVADRGVDEGAAVVDGDAFEAVVQAGLGKLVAHFYQLFPGQNVLLNNN